MTDNTYEALKQADFLPKEAKEAWIKADHKADMLRLAYDGLANDETLNDEYKQRRAEELYRERKDSVESARRGARETILKHAAFAEKNAIPTPNGEPTSSSDPTKYLIDLQRAESLVRSIERQKNIGGPLKRSPSEYLTEQYRQGLKQGGLEGGSLCRGVLKAAEELGISADDVVEPLRSDQDRERLDKSRRLQVAADSISSEAPKPPRSLAGGSAARSRRGGQFTHRAALSLAPDVASEGETLVASETPHSGSSSSSEARKKKRKPSWK